VRKDDRLTLVEGQLYSDTNLRIDNLHLADAGQTSMKGQPYSETSPALIIHQADAGQTTKKDQLYSDTHLRCR